MSSRYIPKSLRRTIFQQSRFRCDYCLASQHILGPLLEIDHIIPVAVGGISEESNLWLACPLCNGAKSDLIQGTDPISGETARFFNPRTDNWQEHFHWLENGSKIQGKTAKGRATVLALKMNEPDVLATRKLWVSVGWHPPKD